MICDFGTTNFCVDKPSDRFSLFICALTNTGQGKEFDRRLRRSDSTLVVLQLGLSLCESTFCRPTRPRFYSLNGSVLLRFFPMPWDTRASSHLGRFGSRFCSYMSASSSNTAGYTHFHRDFVDVVAFFGTVSSRPFRLPLLFTTHVPFT